MKERRKLLLGVYLLLILLPINVQAAIYKWYDENGKAYYSQSPPPKGGQRAPIDTSTFSSLDMHKAPKRKSQPKRRKKTTVKTITKRPTTRSSCPLRR